MGPPGPGTLKLVTAATAGGFAFQNGTKVASTWARAAAGVRVGSAGSAASSILSRIARICGCSSPMALSLRWSVAFLARAAGQREQNEGAGEAGQAGACR